MKNSFDADATDVDVDGDGDGDERVRDCRYFWMRGDTTEVIGEPNTIVSFEPHTRGMNLGNFLSSDIISSKPWISQIITRLGQRGGHV